jgi:hypothetical protein
MIARKRHYDSGEGGGNSSQPSIYIDASWISRKFKGRRGGPIIAILGIATCLLIFVPVCHVIDMLVDICASTSRDCDTSSTLH